MAATATNSEAMGVLVEAAAHSGAWRQARRWGPPTGTDAASAGTPEIFVLSTACSKVEYGETHSGENLASAPIFPALASLGCRPPTAPHPPPPCVAAGFLPGSGSDHSGFSRLSLEKLLHL